MNSTKPAIFLDRDGTINKLNGYITNFEQIQILDGVPAAIKIFNKLEFVVIVITNQPVINMGLITDQELQSIHHKIQSEIFANGGLIHTFLYCPHEDLSKVTNRKLAIDCNCRKPKSGLIDQALKLSPINIKESWLIGDSWRDVELAQNLGINHFQIINANTEITRRSYQVESLFEAAQKINSINTGRE
jgi:D-glycero-D-manno-heptose 1,7-bisphosphate phosphatase